MDSQDSQVPLPHHHHHQSLHHQQAQFHHQHHHQQGPTMMVAPPQQHSSYAAIPSNTMMHQHQHHHHQQQQQQSQHQPQQNPRFPFNSMVNPNSNPGQGQGPGTVPKPAAVDFHSDGSSPGASGFSIEPARKKRGRPRKYSPDGNIALGLSPTPVTPIPSSMAGQPESGGGAGSGAAPILSSENQAKKARGRPPGSIKKQMDALGSAGVGFTPHVITVEPGEDIASKMMEFSQQGPRTVCILSAIGAICNATLRQPSNGGGGTVTLEGQFEIISLSGSYLFSESDGHSTRPSGLSVSLAGADGKVVGGGVAGTLKAASQVQLIVGSFIADGKKPKYKPSSTPPSNPLNFGTQATDASPSEDASSASSDENGGGTPLNRGNATYGGGNVTQPLQTILPMYGNNLGWPNSAVKMHHP